MLKETLRRQANQIDAVLATFGLRGRVTGGKSVGYETRYYWQIKGSFSTDRLGLINPSQVDAALVQELGQGVTWQADPEREDGLLIVVPLPDYDRAEADLHIRHTLAYQAGLS